MLYDSSLAHRPGINHQSSPGNLGLRSATILCNSPACSLRSAARLNIGLQRRFASASSMITFGHDNCYHFQYARWVQYTVRCDCQKLTLIYESAYCKRCEKEFPNSNAKAQHLDDSSRHHRCSVCAFDGLSWNDLLSHHRSTKHRAVCQGCDDGDGVIWNPGSKEYLDHLTEDNVCTVCEGHFDSPSNLEHVGELKACDSSVLMIQ